MSTFDDASLVFIPSGYKTSKAYSVKPIDGTGDLTFTRSNDTASRVASNGLIEKVRTNLILQSNTFSTTWTNLNSTETGGQTGYDGTTNAWLISATGGSAGIIQNISQSGMVTQSVYAKAGTSNWLMLRLTDGTNNNLTYVDLTNRVFGNTGTNFVRGTITDVGGGWSRISVTINQASYNQCAFYVAFGNGSLSTTNETLFIQNAQLEAGDIATDPILTTTAAVSVGPVANVPRLDYLNSSCPRLLLEPQRTNLALFSEQFDNAGWTKENATITANAVTSPSGYQDADTLADNSTNGRHRVSQIMSATNGTTYTYSVFVKKNSSGRFLLINAATLINARAALNLDTLAITNINGTGKVEDYGNGWYRFSVTGTATATSSTATYIQMQNSASDVNYVGNGSSFYLWGAQFEQGSYVSSYIGPTLGAAVTRGADLASKTGISSLIGQTEGVLFVDYVAETPEETRRITLSDGTSANRILIGHQSNGTIQFFIAVSSAAQVSFITSASYTKGTRLKIAFAYKANDFAAYINGAQVLTDNLGTVPASSKFGFADATDSNPFIGSVNQALLFKTRLSNADLAALTA